MAPVRPSTRDALLLAARAILAEEGPSVPVATITKRAGVAVGSFYNHFESKDALFREAAQQALAEWEDYMLRRTESISDPAERLCARIRLMGRMSDIRRETASILVNTGPRLLAFPTGYSSRAVPDFDWMKRDQGLTDDEVSLRLIVVVAAGEKLLALRLADPSIPPERADDLAETLMGYLGLTPTRARKMAHTPLPPEPSD